MQLLRWNRPTPVLGSSVNTWARRLSSFSRCCVDCGNYYHVRAEHQTAHELGEQLLTLAQQVQDPAMLVAAHRALGATLFCLGASPLRTPHFAQGIALLRSPAAPRLGVPLWRGRWRVCHSFAAWTLWFLGYPDQGLARSPRGGDPGAASCPTPLAWRLP